MDEMEIITLAESNIDEEHICCGFSDKKSVQGYLAKKKWLRGQFPKGYTFKKYNVRGKVFIEYVPVEESWLPIEGSGYLLINCFWVSGKYKGKGYGKELLQECLDDSKDKKGVIVITGEKKRPFMNDPGFFKKQGFSIVDRADPFFQLWCRKNDPEASEPRFMDSARRGECQNKQGIVAYYSDCCPFTEYYIGQELRKYAEEKGIPVDMIKITSREQIRELPIPWVISSVFYKGKLVTLEPKADKHLDKVIENN